MAEKEKGKRPASQYYWGEWLNDKALQSCSLPARGLWHEMNCLMHQGEPYGHLTLFHKAMTIPQLANLCRISTALCTKLVGELMAAGVPSIDAGTGAYFSRRMVRDEAVRNARAAGGEGGAEHGSKGGKHGAKGGVHGAKGGRPSKGKGVENPPLPGQKTPPPSSSSSSSSSASPVENPSGSLPATLPGPIPRRPAKQCPEQFAVTTEMVEWAMVDRSRTTKEKGPKPPACPNLTMDLLERETQKFRNHTFGNARVDWVGAWKNWMLRADEDREKELGRQQRSTSRTESLAEKRAATLDAITGRNRNPERTESEADRQRTVDAETRILNPD